MPATKVGSRGSSRASSKMSHYSARPRTPGRSPSRDSNGHRRQRSPSGGSGRQRGRSPGRSRNSDGKRSHGSRSRSASRSGSNYSSRSRSVSNGSYRTSSRHRSPSVRSNATHRQPSGARRTSPGGRGRQNSVGRRSSRPGAPAIFSGSYDPPPPHPVERSIRHEPFVCSEGVTNCPVCPTESDIEEIEHLEQFQRQEDSDHYGRPFERFQDTTSHEGFHRRGSHMIL